MAKKRGRPPINDDAKRNVSFIIRATSAEKRAYDAAATKKGVKLSKWIRDKLNRGLQIDE